MFFENLAGLELKKHCFIDAFFSIKVVVDEAIFFSIFQNLGYAINKNSYVTEIKQCFKKKRKEKNRKEKKRKEKKRKEKKKKQNKTKQNKIILL